MSNFKIQGGLGPLSPLRTSVRSLTYQGENIVEDRANPPCSDQSFWHAGVILICLGDFGTLEYFWHARMILAERGRLHQRNAIANFQHRNYRRHFKRFPAQVIDVWNDNKQIKRHCSITSLTAQSVCCQLTSKTPLALTCWWSFRDYSEVRNCSSE